LSFISNFYYGFGEGIARVFPSLRQKARDSMWNKLLELGVENQDFPFGFSETIAGVIESIGKSDFENIIELAAKIKTLRAD
jgi:hypothetical protein